jgi:5-methyltetrahydrofolate corrinoid/iron sulfur protein methyltransferase
MLTIGERINGMFKDIGRAIAEHNEKVIQDWALRQVEAGADMLDVNVGPAAADAEAAMVWLVRTIRAVTDVPLCLDSTKPSVIKAGLEAAEGKNVMINSTTAVPEKMAAMFPLAAQYNCPIIGLTIDANGVPRDADGRLEVALQLVTGCLEHGIPSDRLYIDAVILPVNTLQQVPREVFKTISMCRTLADPPPKTILGLSNVSQGAAQRSLLNRTCLVMAIAHGLDAAILDVTDEALMEAMIAAEVLMNRHVYCDDFVRAYRASRARR